MPSAPLRGDALRARFDALDRHLVEHRALWRPRPFAEGLPAWGTDHPDVADWLRAQPPDAVARLDSADGVWLPDDAPRTLRRWHDEAAALAEVGAWPVDPRVAAALDGRPALRVGAGARKWAQVARFCGCCLPADPRASTVLDWCGGKAHLGRTLGLLSDRDVTVVELNEGLRPRALQLAERLDVALTFAHLDARADAARLHLSTSSSVVALHACGGLTNALIAGVRAHPVADLALAPCCFHLQHGPGDALRPLSRRGQQAQLTLDHATLRLATVEEVHATDRQRARRRREDAWRLGLDLLLRAGSGEDRYRPLGPIAPDTLALPFAQFCRTAADEHQLPLPPDWSHEEAERAGERRAADARALSTVRALFRRALELWLVLDRALALDEAGYRVGVATFCDRSITPRNLLIRGVAAGAKHDEMPPEAAPA